MDALFTHSVYLDASAVRGGGRPHRCPNEGTGIGLFMTRKVPVSGWGRGEQKKGIGPNSQGTTLASVSDGDRAKMSGFSQATPRISPAEPDVGVCISTGPVAVPKHWLARLVVPELKSPPCAHACLHCGNGGGNGRVSFKRGSTHHRRAQLIALRRRKFFPLHFPQPFRRLGGGPLPSQPPAEGCTVAGLGALLPASFRASLPAAQTPLKTPFASMSQRPLAEYEVLRRMPPLAQHGCATWYSTDLLRRTRRQGLTMRRSKENPQLSGKAEGVSSPLADMFQKHGPGGGRHIVVTHASQARRPPRSPIGNPDKDHLWNRGHISRSAQLSGLSCLGHSARLTTRISVTWSTR